LLSLSLILFGLSAWFQATFSVSPGLLNLNSATISDEIQDHFSPYFGFQTLSAGAELVETSYRTGNGGDLEEYTNEDKFSARLISPTLRVKYHFEGEDKEIKHFVNLALAKPFLSGKARFNGENNLDFTEQLASIDLFGMELGYGARYFFDTRFSIRGEFGLRVYRVEVSETRDRTFYTGQTNTYEEKSIDSNVAGRISPTYSRIGLSVHF
jgi:hypothetical protein